ncbi:MAG: 4Fe-4S dicluster domain-containing protein [Deltaproteobacteria bacterium]
MDWTDEAKKAVSRVPFFVRKRVKKRVEEEAERCGAKRVTMEHVHTCQQRFLKNMEDEVRGFQVETCFGPSGCPNRAVVWETLPAKLEETLAGRKLKDFLKQRVEGPLKMHHEFRVSVSDCPNACSRPQIVDVGLIGACVPVITEQACSECGACVDACKESALVLRDGRPVLVAPRCLTCGQCVRVCPTGALREGKKGYRILVGGKLGRHPRLGVELPGIYESEEALQMLDRCLDLYQQGCRSGERFGEILEREGATPLRAGQDKESDRTLVENAKND